MAKTPEEELAEFKAAMAKIESMHGNKPVPVSPQSDADELAAYKEAMASAMAAKPISTISTPRKELTLAEIEPVRYPEIGTAAKSAIYGLTGELIPTVAGAAGAGLFGLPLKQGYVAARDIVGEPLRQAAAAEPGIAESAQIAGLAGALATGVGGAAALRQLGLKEAAKRTAAVLPTAMASGAAEQVASAPTTAGKVMTPEEIAKEAAVGATLGAMLSPLGVDSRTGAIELAGKRRKSDQLELPLIEKKDNEGQPEISIEEGPSQKEIVDTFVEPDVDVPYIDLSGERPKLTVIKGEGKKQPRKPRTVNKEFFDIINEAEKGIPIKDKPIPDNELVDPDAQKLLEETDPFAALRTAGRMREPGKNTREMLAEIVAQREMAAPRDVAAEGAMLAAPGGSRTPVDISDIDRTTMLDIEPASGSAAQSPLSEIAGDVDARDVDYPEISADELDAVDRFHPVFEEAKRSAEKIDADEGYKLALERFNPVYKFEKADGLALMQYGLAPLQRPQRHMPGITKPSKFNPPSEEDFYVVTSKLGEGVYGRVHTVVDETGAKKVAKISAPSNYDQHMADDLRHERNVALEMQKLRKNATKEDQKYLRHFPTIEKVLPNPLDPKNGYVFVMKELRPMNDYELALLFKGRKFAEDELLNLEYPYRGEDFVFPLNWTDRKALTSADYKNMPENVRKFYNALEWLADTHNIKWNDLHDENIMIDPATNEYVALDMGQFALKGEIPPGVPERRLSSKVQKTAVAQAAVERGRKPASSAELALEIAKERWKDVYPTGWQQIKSGKARGMVVLPFGGKGKPKQLPEKTESSQTTAMVPSLSKQEMELAARDPSVMQRIGKITRTALGKLTPDEIVAERKILQSELKWAQQQLISATTDAEIRAAERAQNAAFMKLNKFDNDYLDLEQAIGSTSKKQNLSEILGKTKRSVQGALTVDEFRAQRKILEEELDFAKKKLQLATTDAEIKAVNNAIRTANAKLVRFANEYPDIDDLTDLLSSISERESKINNRFTAGAADEPKSAAAITVDAESNVDLIVKTGQLIRDVFDRYPELYDNLPEDHPLLDAYNKFPEVERAWSESRGLAGKLEEMLGLKQSSSLIQPKKQKKRTADIETQAISSALDKAREDMELLPAASSDPIKVPSKEELEQVKKRREEVTTRSRKR
jgi:hypothetical protein